MQTMGISEVTVPRGNCGFRLAWLVSLPLALALFAAAGYAGWINFGVQIHSVVMIGIIFVIYLFFVPHNAYFAVCRFRRGFSRTREALERYIRKNLLQIGGVEKANASFDDFVAAEAAVIRNANFSSVAAGIFPTLGILGTFISIAVSMPDFTSQTSAGLEREISRLLGGVGTAFYVSIYGIFLSIWWIFFEKTGLSRFERDVARIREAVRERFWGKEEIEQTYFRRSMEHFEKLNTVFDHLSSREFVSALNDTLRERMALFDTLIDEERRSIERTTALLEQSSERSAQFSQRQSETSEMLEGLMKRLEGFALTLEAQAQRTRELESDALRTYEAGARSAEALHRSVGELSRALEPLDAHNVERIAQTLARHTQQVESRLAEIGERLDVRLEDFDAQFLEKLRATLVLIDSETAKIIERLAELDRKEDFL